MASADKPKKITREELAGLPRTDLSKVKTKRRVMASLPSAEDAETAAEGADTETDQELSTRERMSRAIAAEEARKNGD